MSKKNYRCQSCGSSVYLSMIHCDQCGTLLYIDPQRFVCNLAVVTMKTENLPMEKKIYRLQYDMPFNTMEDLLKQRHRVYLWYRLNNLKKGRLKVGDAAHYVPVGVRWEWLTKHIVYCFATITDFPQYIQIAE